MDFTKSKQQWSFQYIKQPIQSSYKTLAHFDGLYWILILTSCYISEKKCKRLDMTPVSKLQESSNLIKNIKQIKGWWLKDLWSTLHSLTQSERIQAESKQNLVGLLSQWAPSQIWLGLGMIPTKFRPNSDHSEWNH